MNVNETRKLVDDVIAFLKSRGCDDCMSVMRVAVSVQMTVLQGYNEEDRARMVEWSNRQIAGSSVLYSYEGTKQ